MYLADQPASLLEKSVEDMTGLQVTWYMPYSNIIVSIFFSIIPMYTLIFY